MDESEEEEIIDVEIIEDEPPPKNQKPPPSNFHYNPFETRTTDKTSAFSTDKETRSSNEAIQVDWLPNAPCKGRLGITFAPGKSEPISPSKSAGQRELCADLDRLRGFYQADVLFSWIENVELEQLIMKGILK